MRDPVNELKGALRTYLLADATLVALLKTNQSVFEDGNHREEPLPLITYSRAGGGEEHTLEGRTACRRIFSVKAIAGGTAGSKAAGIIAARIDELLDSQTFTIASPFRITEVKAVAPIDYRDPADGELYSHVGASYEIWVAAAS